MPKKTLKTVQQWLCPPPVFDFWMEQLNINRRWDTPTAKVISHHIIDNSVLQLTLKPSKFFDGFKAGQHIGISGIINGMLTERCYSIANLPNDDNIIELGIKIQGHASRWLSHSVKTGSVLGISQAWGESHKAPYSVYIAGGIGITAIYPLVMKALSQPSDKPVKLIYLADKSQPWLYRAAIEKLTSSKFTAVFADGRQAIDQADFLKNHINPTDNVICCGSAGFTDAIKGHLKDHVNTLDHESFSPPEIAAPNGERKNVTITLTKSQKSIITDNQTNILNALLNAGVAIKKGCRQGICQQCSCQLNTGSITQRQKTVSTSSIDSKIHSFQPCISMAQSDIALNL